MTVEHLHDALTLLPADLVAAADKRRSRKAPSPVLRRVAAIAACFAVMLLIGRLCLPFFAMKASDSTAEQMNAAAPESPAAAPESYTYAAEDQAPAEAVSEEGPSLGTEVDLQLPLLTIRDAGCSMALEARGFEWTIHQPDGGGITTHADVSSPTQYPDSLPLLEIFDGSIDLYWEQQPDSVVIQCWKLDEGDWVPEALETASESNSLPIASGEHIYEITASWEQGYTSYAFRVTAP